MVEFYEFIVRLADIKFKGEANKSMVDKTIVILDILFKVIGKKREKKEFNI